METPPGLSYYPYLPLLCNGLRYQPKLQSRLSRGGRGINEIILAVLRSDEKLFGTQMAFNIFRICGMQRLKCLPSTRCLRSRISLLIKMYSLSFFLSTCSSRPEILLMEGKILLRTH